MGRPFGPVFFMLKVFRRYTLLYFRGFMFLCFCVPYFPVATFQCSGLGWIFRCFSRIPRAHALGYYVFKSLWDFRGQIHLYRRWYKTIITMIFNILKLRIGVNDFTFYMSRHKFYRVKIEYDVIHYSRSPH